VSDYREWVHQRRDDRQKKVLAERALDTFEALAACDAVPADRLTPILEAAAAPHQVAWEIGMHFLCRLGARHEPAREAMRGLMRSRKAEVRARLLGAVHDRLPKEFCIELARRGLADKSKRVRGVAAIVCRCFILTEMLDDLRQAASAEADPAAKWEMELAVGLIRDTYFVYPRPDGSRAFVVRLSDGCPAEMLWPGPGWCTPADIDRRGPAAVAEEIRRVSGRTVRPFRWSEQAAEPRAAADRAGGRR